MTFTLLVRLNPYLILYSHGQKTLFPKVIEINNQTEIENVYFEHHPHLVSN